MRVNKINVALGCIMIWSTGSLLLVNTIFLPMFIYFHGNFVKPDIDKFTDSCLKW